MASIHLGVLVLAHRELWPIRARARSGLLLSFHIQQTDTNFFTQKSRPAILAPVKQMSSQEMV